MRNRTAFTLIEMLVAMTLTLFIMVIVSTAFIAGLETFRGLKAIGDMQENLRQATLRLRADLAEDHFEGKRRLGDLAFPAQGKVRMGFFRITKPSAPINEGVDLDNLPSLRAVDQVFHFSVKMRGDRPQDFYAAKIPFGAPYAATNPKPFDPGTTAVPNPFFKPTTYFNQPSDASFQQAGTYSSQWAEVAYYLVRAGTTDDPEDPNATTGTPLYSLYRVQRVVVPRNDQLQKVVPVGQMNTYGEFSCQPEIVTAPATPQFLDFNTPEDLAVGKRSFTLGPTQGLGAALLLSNVVSFRIEMSNSGGAFQDLPGGVFDTATTVQRVSGIQITLRIWEPVTLQSRQVTMIQDM